MKSPFNNFDKAFDAMFTETVMVSFTRNNVENKQSIKVNIFLDNTEMPIDDNVMDSNIEQILLIIKQKDWAFCKTLARGDTITRNNGKQYGVMSVNDDELMGLVITARKK